MFNNYLKDFENSQLFIFNKKNYKQSKQKIFKTIKSF